MAHSNHYAIKYHMNKAYNFDDIKTICVPASNKAEAWLTGKDAIRWKEGKYPAALWVFSVTYQNGKYRLFDTNETHPY